MKKLFILLFLTGILKSVFAQAPQGFSYQAAVRNAAGQVKSNSNIKVCFSILDSVSNGAIVYKETHLTTTNSLGMMNLNVGMGTPIIGSLSGVNWGTNAKFLQVEIDTTASGNNYMLIGVQQLMSVPYAINSFSANQLLPVNLIDKINKPQGSYVGQFGTYQNEGDLYYWNGFVWIKLRRDNCPPPSISNAGVNLNLLNFEETNLNANMPIIGKGCWKIISGNGGVISNIYDNKSSFFGVPNSIYNLAWVISNNCDSSLSQIEIKYNQSISFSESGSWIIPKGIDSVKVEIFGGGGGGENPPPCYFGYGCWNKGSGGGSGGYGVFYLSTNSMDSISFKIGKGGTPQNDGDSSICMGYYATGGKCPLNSSLGGVSNCVEFINGQNGGIGSSGRYYIPGGNGAGGVNGIGNGGDGGLFDLTYGRSYGAQNGGDGRIIFTTIK